ncbi:hypothetical protein PROFUN_06927 [Planoprotostelium fungivorum]|uniref:Epidermal growth factor-like domain-containing protein n=1 Tax=Planoprotostelium fungivorum TaxID=1890364 RepID=A0A2P6NMX4_9EUKA|nr:hypothetical protein PROFUN_06927 [Planoprotostelium fungivorum]
MPELCGMDEKKNGGECRIPSSSHRRDGEMSHYHTLHPYLVLVRSSSPNTLPQEGGEKWDFMMAFIPVRISNGYHIEERLRWFGLIFTDISPRWTSWLSVGTRLVLITEWVEAIMSTPPVTLVVGGNYFLNNFWPASGVRQNQMPREDDQRLGLHALEPGALLLGGLVESMRYSFEIRLPEDARKLLLQITDFVQIILTAALKWGQKCGITTSAPLHGITTGNSTILDFIIQHHTNVLFVDPGYISFLTPRSISPSRTPGLSGMFGVPKSTEQPDSPSLLLPKAGFGYLLVVAALSLLEFVSAQTTSIEAPNSTTVGPPARFCSDSPAGACNGRGICTNIGTCYCWRGWIATTNMTTGESSCITSEYLVGQCENSCIPDFLDQGYGGPILAMRIIFSICFALQWFLVSYRLLLEKFGHSRNSNGLAPTAITRLILGLVQFFGWSLDWHGLYRIGSIKYGLIVDYVQLPNLILLFSIMLAYWIDFYQAVIIKMKKEEMLRKINSNYESRVTFDDILLQISKMRRVKVVVIIINILCYAIFIAFMGTIFHTTEPKPTNTYLAMVTWYAVVSLLLGVGYTFAGHKLVGMMPPQLSARIRRLTRKMILVAAALTILNLFGMGANVKPVPGTTLYLSKTGVTTALGLIVRMLAIDIYLPFANIKRWLWGMSFGTSSTDKTGPSSREDKHSQAKDFDIELTTAQPSSSAV